MALSFLSVRLPLLHRELCPAGEAGEFLSIWPGLSGMPAEGYWVPEYPFSEREAIACMHDMRAMGEAALSGVPVQMLAATQATAVAAREAEERSALEEFARHGEAGAANPDIERRAAQKALLWAWLLEEEALEMQRLMQSYTEGEARLAAGLDADFSGEPALAGIAGEARLQPLSDISDMLPPWRTVLENAAVFLPENALILVENQDMRETLLECECPSAAQGRYELHMPLWQVLGRKAPCCPRQEKLLHLLVLETAQGQGL